MSELETDVDDWEPYEPCPNCGNHDSFKEVVKCVGTQALVDGEPSMFDLEHIGQAMEIICPECSAVLFNRRKEDTDL